MGEYVSLNKVESALKLHELVENLCICARPSETFTVALVVPEQVFGALFEKISSLTAYFFFQTQLQKLAIKLGKTEFLRRNICRDNETVQIVLELLTSFGASMKLQNFEIPKKIILVEEYWYLKIELQLNTIK